MAIIYLPETVRRLDTTKLEELDRFQTTLDSFLPSVLRMMNYQSSQRKATIPSEDGSKGYILGDYHNFEPHSSQVADESVYLFTEFISRLPIIYNSHDIERRRIALRHHGLWHDYRTLFVPFIQEAIDLPAPPIKLLRWVNGNTFPHRTITVKGKNGYKAEAGALYDDRISSEAYSALSLANMMLIANLHSDRIIFRPQDISDAYTNIVGGTKVKFDNDFETVYTPYMRHILTNGFLGKPNAQVQEIPLGYRLTFHTPNLLARLETLAMSYADLGIVLRSPHEALRQSVALFFERLFTHPPKELLQIGNYLKAWEARKLAEEKKEVVGKTIVSLLGNHLFGQDYFVEGRMHIKKEEIDEGLKGLGSIKAFMRLRHRFGGNTRTEMSDLFVNIENENFMRVLKIMAERRIIDTV
jgi:hypothetical protein